MFIHLMNGPQMQLFQNHIAITGRKFFSVITKRYYRNILESISDVKYINTILIINPEALGKDTLILLRRNILKLKLFFIYGIHLKTKNIYQIFSGSVIVFIHLITMTRTSLVLLFAIVFSVKPQETDKIEKKKIIFIGSVHSTRLDIISKINNIAVSNNINFKFNLYFPSRLIFWFSFLRKKVLGMIF